MSVERSREAASGLGPESSPARPPLRVVDGATPPSLFRAAASADHAAGDADLGRPLEVEPRWLGRLVPALLLTVALALGVAAVVPLAERVDGVAVVRLGDRAEVSTRRAGPVAEVYAAVGDTVAAGQPLLRVGDPPLEGHRLLLERAFRLQLVERLRRPRERGASLAELRAGLDEAALELEALLVRAPAAGRLLDLRVRRGEAVAAGQVVAALGVAASEVATEDGSASAEATAWVFLPGAHRPRLEIGAPLRLELDGFPQRTVPRAGARLRVRSVSESVVGPAEARRLLGTAHADAVAVAGPVVVVRAALAEPWIETDGRRLEIADGMIGRAEVTLRRRSLLVALLPGLEALFDRGTGVVTGGEDV